MNAQLRSWLTGQSGSRAFEVRPDAGTPSDLRTLSKLTAEFDAMHALYIADGHHRSAAASRVCAARKAANPQHTGSESYN